jgi:tetratricopeptide (TPR) repeat protein
MSLPAMSSFEFAQEAASGTIETDHADDSVPGEGVPMQERLRMLSFAEDTFNLGSTHNWETLYADSPPAVSLFCAYRAATMHRTLEEYEEAERWHRKALEVDPNFIPSLVDLAELARLRDDDEQDLELLTRAWMIDPTSWRLRSHLEYRPGLVDELEWRALEAVDASREAEEN